MHDPKETSLPQKKKYIRKARKRIKGLSFNRVVPNILTMLGLCAGLSAIKFSLLGQFSHALEALIAAACLDGLDGRIARLLRGTSRFGAELDSLSDIVCFGLVPPFILVMWALPATGRFGFIPCMMFTVCMALRLARFNSALDDDNKPEYSANFFTGVPAPAGAGLALFPVFLGLEAEHNHLHALEAIAHSPLLATFCLIGTSFLLVSTLPVWSFKNFKVPSAYILPMLISTCLYAAFLLTEPWGALAGSGLFYLLMLPFSRASYWRIRRQAEANLAEISASKAEKP